MSADAGEEGMPMKVFISAGHGGSDPGAVANGIKEKDWNLSIALACRDELERHGVEVRMSRTKDENDPVAEEIRECNAYAPDLAVSIHNNAGGGDGAEVFHHHGGGKGRVLAENILSEIVKVGQNSRGVKIRKNSSGKDYYGFIRETSCPAVIVECAFVDNAVDAQILATEAKRKSMGQAVAKGVLKTLGKEYEPERGHWKVQVGAYLYRENAEAMQKKIKAVGFDAFIVKE
jgi:N-acetylmuramoyl-L-alanine amidase